MLAMLRTVLNAILTPPPLPEDVSTTPHDLERFGSRLRTNAIDRRLTKLTYVRQISLAICLAQVDTANGVSTLHFDDRTKQQERLVDKRDTRISLADCITKNNLTNGSGHARFDINVAIVVLVTLVITDPDWDPQVHYVRVSTDRVGSSQTSTLLIGNRDVILARSAEPASSAKAKRQTCAFSHSTIDGWCMSCGSRPRVFSLFHAPLDHDEIFKYATELLSATGTHGHIKHSRTGTSDGNDSIEVAPESTLGQDLCHKGVAMFQAQSASSNSTIFVAGAEWAKEVQDASNRILFSIPITDLSHASITIAVRGDQQSVRKTLSAELHVHCIGPSE